MRTARATGVGRVPFVNNQIPNSRLSPAAINLLKLIPAPSLPGVQNNYVASGFGVYNFNQADTRIDYQLKPTVHIFGRYGYLGSNQGSPASLGAVGGNGFGVGGWAGNETGGNDSLAVGTDLVGVTQAGYRYSIFLLSLCLRRGQIRWHNSAHDEPWMGGFKHGRAGIGGRITDRDRRRRRQNR